MSYIITNTQGATVATVADGTVDSTSTSLTLIGKNYAGYGVFLNDNYVKLLENFSKGSEPTSPLNGQLWFDSTNRVLKIRDSVSSQWKSLCASTTSPQQPTSPIIGDLWWDVANNQLKAYGGSTWILVGPTFTTSSGQSGAIVETVIDTNSYSHVAIKFYIQNSVIAIVSKDSTYTPQTAISGYTTISPGINLVSSSTIANAAFNGDVANALAVGGIPASSLLRNDQSGTISGSLNVNNNTGLTVGGSNNFTIGINSLNQAVTLVNSQASADVSFYVTPYGQAATEVLTIDGASGQILMPNLIASTSTTTGALVVAGGVGVGGALYIGGSASVSGTTQSTSTTTGALVVAGGVGVGGATTTANLTVTGYANVSSGIASSSTTTGALIVSGGLGVTGNINAGNINAGYISGNIIGTVSSIVTSVGTLSNLAVTGVAAFGNIVYANAGISSTSTSTGTIILSSVGGIGVGGNINIGANVNALASRITNTLTVGNIQASANNISNIGSATSGFSFGHFGNILPLTNSVGNIGSPTAYYNRVHATSTSALYSDLAERYAADAHYEPGTVVEIGGIQEITIASLELSDKVFGVISTQPAYIMNDKAGSDETHPAVALQGRVPVKVIGTVNKGDRLVSAGNGRARAATAEEITPFNVIGRALVDKTIVEEDLIMAVVKAIS
jgi:hypothetical protein